MRHIISLNLLSLALLMTPLAADITLTGDGTPTDWEKEGRVGKGYKELYLSLNIDEGTKLQLSDGTTYEIAPEDRIYCSLWITPFPLRVGESNNPDYPIKITNLQTGTSVKARLISAQQMLQDEKQHSEPAPQTEPTPTPSEAPAQQ